ncbi:hypothetical protein H5410_020913 [Solanum commersonii]|uniref:Uncharacterized protein n=1 Tax=Solanum commersonii TaxID=4109 RepID=A0A9J5ZCP3_SOLCO|nr:hypothetical protein H5410_020913 [Solanum commersonii]
MGAGSGKSHLSNPATHFRGETINSNKMQVYKRLEIVTNKITHNEKQGEIEPDFNFKAEDFFYIEKHVEDPVFMYKYKYDTCFIWIDVEQSILNCRVDIRVAQMVNEDNFVIVLCINQDIIMHLAKNFSYIIFLIIWLVDEVHQIFIPDADYIKGI